jgi:hypothetical protein
MRDAYGLSPGDWVLVRPDGYVGAMVSGSEVSAIARQSAFDCRDNQSNLDITVRHAAE